MRRPRLRYFDGSVWSDQVKDDVVGEFTDPLGPLPPNRDAWLSPHVMSMLAQPQPPPEPTIGELLGWRGSVVIGVLVLAVVTTLAITRPGVLGPVVGVGTGLAMLGARLWLSDVIDEVDEKRGRKR